MYHFFKNGRLFTKGSAMLDAGYVGHPTGFQPNKHGYESVVLTPRPTTSIDIVQEHRVVSARRNGKGVLEAVWDTVLRDPSYTHEEAVKRYLSTYGVYGDQQVIKRNDAYVVLPYRLDTDDRTIFTDNPNLYMFEQLPVSYPIKPALTSLRIGDPTQRAQKVNELGEIDDALNEAVVAYILYGKIPNSMSSEELDVVLTLLELTDVYVEDDTTLLSIKASLRVELESRIGCLLDRLVEESAAQEVDSWDVQLNAALNYTTDDGARELLESLLLPMETVEELSAKIIEKNRSFNLARTGLIRRRRLLHNTIDHMASEDVELVRERIMGVV